MGTLGRGFLRHGVPLEDSDSVRLKPSSADHRYGTLELVTALAGAAQAVAEVFPSSRLTVGDLSQRGGGRIRPHRSHRRGLDADVGFYLVGPEGLDTDGRRFVQVDAEGLATDGSGRRFDVARNWAFLEHLLAPDRARVQYVFLFQPLIERLLEHAERSGATPEAIEAARLVLQQPRRGARHDNHFHVRIYCPPDDRPACEDRPPFHPWYGRDDAVDASALVPPGAAAHPRG